MRLRTAVLPALLATAGIASGAWLSAAEPSGRAAAAPARAAALKRIDRPAGLSLVFGTGCGASKEHIPHLLKTLHAAANPQLSVRLVALDLDFRRPADVIQGRRIINVPTILV